MFLGKLIAFTMAILFSISAFSFSGWDSVNSPDNFQNNFETKFRQLPAFGELKKKP